MSGSKLVSSWSAKTLSAAPWNDPANAPGNCPADPGAVKLNTAGFAELDTTGQNGSCTSVQSPATLPTKPGYVYEARVYFSSFNDWPAFWMYGANWPDQGEIDAVEGGPGESLVTWHQAGNQTTGIGAWNNNPVTANAGVPDISAGAWHVVDVAFTAKGVSVYYDGKDYVDIPESVTTAGSDPMWLTISEGSCAEPGGNVCANGASSSPAGNVQVSSVSEFS